MKYNKQRIFNFFTFEVFHNKTILSDLPELYYSRKKNKETYPEIGNSSFWSALWTFKQQLTLKVQALCAISIVLL